MIFGIGLPKTGNTSLACYLAKQGLNGVRYPSPQQWVNLSAYNYVIDTPCNIYYEQLQIIYPDAKFILTTRNDGDWLVSWNKHKQRTSLKTTWQKHFRHILLQQQLTPSEHEKNVKAIIKADNLFTLDLDNLDIKSLCNFLSLKYNPNYPHKNATQK